MIAYPTFSRAASSLRDIHRSCLASFLMNAPGGVADRMDATIPTTTIVLSTLHLAA